MKILQVVDFFKPSWEAGGIVRVCYEVSKRLLDEGHEVTVYTTDGFKSRLKVKKNRSINVEGMEVYYFRNLSLSLAKRNLCLPYLLPYIAKKNIQKFDIIHIHTFRSSLVIPIWYYAKKYGVPYVLQAHGSVLHISQKQRLKKIFDLFFGYKILKGASKLIAVTMAEVGQYKGMRGVDEYKIEITPNTIEQSEYDNLPERGEFREKYLISEDEKIILYLGRLHKSKDVALLVDAFADISRDLDNVRLVLVGPDDGYRSALEKLIQSLKVEDKVLFTGFVSQDEKRRALVDADVFVNPRADEIFGLVLLEANACGTPVICSKGCGIADVIDGKTGFAVHNGKIQLREAIITILMDEELGKMFGEEGRRLARGEFSRNNIAKNVENIYKSSISVKQKVD